MTDLDAVDQHLDEFLLADLAALGVLALATRSLTRKTWAGEIEAYGLRNPAGREFTAKQLTALSDRCIALGFIHERIGAYGRSQPLLELIPTVANALLIRLHRHGGLASMVETATQSERGPSWLDSRPRAAVMLRAALAMNSPGLVAVYAAALEHWSRSEFGTVLLNLFGTAPPDGWIEQLSDEITKPYVELLVEVAMWNLVPIPPQLPAWVARFEDVELSLRFARLQALRGEANAAAPLRAYAKRPKWSVEGVELIERFISGDYRAAVEHGDATVALMKSRKYKQLYGIEGVFHALARVVTLNEDSERGAALRKSIHYAYETERGPIRDVYRRLVAFEDASRDLGPDLRLPWALAEQGPGGWLEILVQLVCVHWLGVSPATALPQRHEATARLQQMAERFGYPGLAREFAALLAIYAGGGPPTPSLAAAYAPLEPWETILAAFETTAKTVHAATATTVGFRKHLVWEVEPHRSYVSVTAKLIATERSHKGKAVALRTLQSDKVDYLTDADRRVVVAASMHGDHRGGSTLYHPELLLALVDHPRVRRSSGAPLRITRGQPAIRSRKGDEGTILELDPPELARVAIHYRELAPNHLEVLVRDPALASIYELFARSPSLTIPTDGRKRLLDSLADLATATELRIEGDTAPSSRTVDADPRVVMRLEWNGTTFVASAKVAPLGPHAAHFAAGQGPRQIVGRVADEMLACTRDLAEENRRFEALLDACPALASQPEDEGCWSIPELETALEILLELHALGDEVVLTWPKGRPLAPPRLIGAKDLRIDVAAKQDWLHVDIELAVDEQQVLSFRELLGNRHGDGRFVAIGDGQFLALTADLRRRIDALENLGAVKQAKITAHPVTLPLIEDIVGEQAQLRADARAKARLAELRKIADKTPRLPRGLQAKLRDYQSEGYRWMVRLADARLGAVLADDMGLGKTIQALALLCQRSKRGPALVVAPSSVVSNWQAEAERFAPQLRCRLLAKADDRAALLAALGPGDLLLCSYGLLVSEAEALAELSFATIVFDEAHALKNSASRRSKAAFALQAEFRLALTGTPLENHLGELWSVFQATVPGLLSTQKRFDQRFTRPITNGQRERARQLRALLRPFVLRRTKAQVLDELPPRTEVTIRVDPHEDERAFYEALRRQAVDRIAGLSDKGGKSRLRILAEITRLRQAAIDPRLVDPAGPPGSKITTLIRRLVDLRAEGHRALVFTQFLGSLAAIHELLDAQGVEYRSFDGSTPTKQRDEAIAEFQAGEADVFVMSLKAGGVGINLTGADYVIHLDPWWNPAVEDQATGRAHRIGQQRPVTVYRLVTVGTIEEKILELHASKRDLADDLLSGLDSAKKLDLDELRALL
jgi:superfamily II DNA or RNA helicase